MRIRTDGILVLTMGSLEETDDDPVLSEGRVVFDDGYVVDWSGRTSMLAVLGNNDEVDRFVSSSMLTLTKRTLDVLLKLAKKDPSFLETKE